MTGRCPLGAVALLAALAACGGDSPPPQPAPPGGRARVSTAPPISAPVRVAAAGPGQAAGNSLDYPLRRFQAMRDLYLDAAQKQLNLRRASRGEIGPFMIPAGDGPLGAALTAPDGQARIVSRIRYLQQRLAQPPGPVAFKPFGTGRGGPTPAPVKWRNLGPTNVSGRVASVAVDRAQRIYRGTAGGGVWRFDGSAGWTPLTDELGTLSIGAVAVSPSNDDIVYVATGEGSIAGDGIDGIGIARSTDGGRRWQLHLPETPAERIPLKGFDLSIHPQRADEVLAATDLGILKTVDGGRRWTRISEGLPADLYATAIARSATNPDDLVAAMWEYFGRGFIYTSSNGGNSWRLAGGAGIAPFSDNTGRLSIARSPGNPLRIYAMAAAANRDATGCGAGAPARLDQIGLYKSVDGGRSWTHHALPAAGDCQRGFTAILADGWYANALAVDPADDRVLYAGGLNVWQSTDEGASWKLLSNYTAPVADPDYVHADIHAFAWQGRDLLIASDGGLHRLPPGAPASFTRMDAGCVTRQYYSVAMTPADPSLVVGGTQDNGTNIRVAGTSDYLDVLPGDGFGTAVDPRDAKVIYATWPLTRVHKSIDGQTFTEIGPAYSQELAPFITPLAMDGDNPDVLFTGTNFLWKSVQGRATVSGHWTRLPQDFAEGGERGYITVIVSRDQGSRVFVGTAAGTVWRSDDGTAFQRIGAFDKAVLALEPDPRQPGAVFVGLGGGSPPHLWRIDAGGAKQPRSTGLRARVPVHAIKADVSTPQTLFAGTDDGLFVSTNDGGNWKPLGIADGLPAVAVWAIAMSPDGRVIRLGTHGRGFYELIR